MKLPENVYTGIWWYARFPNHYSGDGSAASTEMGQFKMNAWIDGIVKAIRAVKADGESLKLQNEFFEKASHPLETQALGHIPSSDLFEAFRLGAFNRRAR